jgi:hypothetical protein
VAAVPVSHISRSATTTLLNTTATLARHLPFTSYSICTTWPLFISQDVQVNEAQFAAGDVPAIRGVSKKFGELYQKTNKTEDTHKLTLLAFKIIVILHNTLLAVTRSWIAATSASWRVRTSFCFPAGRAS